MEDKKEEKERVNSMLHINKSMEFKWGLFCYSPLNNNSFQLIPFLSIIFNNKTLQCENPADFPECAFCFVFLLPSYTPWIPFSQTLMATQMAKSASFLFWDPVGAGVSYYGRHWAVAHKSSTDWARPVLFLEMLSIVTHVVAER